MKKLLSVIGVVAMMVLAACSDDDDAVRERFSFGDKSLSVKDAKIYLVYDGTYDDRLERDYVITDGVYDEDEGEFTGATYFIQIYLASAEGANNMRRGEYENWYYWDEAPASERIGYIEAYSSMEDDNYFSLETLQNADGDDDIEVSGGFEVGETITFEYSGDLGYYHQNANDDWVTETVSGKFVIKGKIREANLPLARKSQGRKQLQ